jgi:hypothetical protein
MIRRDLWTVILAVVLALILVAIVKADATVDYIVQPDGRHMMIIGDGFGPNPIVDIGDSKVFWNCRKLEEQRITENSFTTIYDNTYPRMWQDTIYVDVVRGDLPIGRSVWLYVTAPKAAISAGFPIVLPDDRHWWTRLWDRVF